jgi:hypothetical protein
MENLCYAVHFQVSIIPGFFLGDLEKFQWFKYAIKFNTRIATYYQEEGKYSGMFVVVLIDID